MLFSRALRKIDNKKAGKGKYQSHTKTGGQPSKECHSQVKHSHGYHTSSSVLHFQASLKNGLVFFQLFYSLLTAQSAVQIRNCDLPITGRHSGCTSWATASPRFFSTHDNTNTTIAIDRRKENSRKQTQFQFLFLVLSWLNAAVHQFISCDRLHCIHSCTWKWKELTKLANIYRCWAAICESLY